MILSAALGICLVHSILAKTPRELYDAVMGDAKIFNEVFLPPIEIPDFTNNKNATNEDLEDPKAYFAAEIKRITARSKALHGLDTKEFEDITEDLSKHMRNLTRRQWFGYWDPQDDYKHNITFDVEIEKMKKMKLIQLQFLIHSRYKIDWALNEREIVRQDKRYKMGYLFNKMRRMKYEQMKLISTCHFLMKTEFNDLKSFMRMYEEVVHFDVDLKDLIKYVKELDLEYFSEEDYTVYNGTDDGPEKPQPEMDNMGVK